MMNINEVQKRIKQRPPFQMIEKIVEIRDGEYAKGIKNVSINEPYFMVISLIPLLCPVCSLSKQLHSFAP